MLDNPYQLIALRMGGGKTVVTLTAVDELMRDRFEISKTLVVAPLRVAELVWQIGRAHV
jgi:superfamily II DNA or RNA helicase